MNLRFLGDAFDHWKGSIFSHLVQRKLLFGLRVDPMATDQADWTELDYSTYSQLLRVENSSLVEHRSNLQDDRHEYIQETLHTKGDLFLDPDTGISTNDRPGIEHLKASELKAILDDSRDRLTMVYQHNSRGPGIHHRVDQVMTHLSKHGVEFHALAYESTSVAMLFFSSSTARLSAIARFYNQLLGRHAGRRVFQW